MSAYVHGYSARERRRLRDQARTLEELFHHDSVYPAGARVLEAGCGIGAQTVALARRNPRTRFVSVDIDPASLAAAAARLRRARIRNAELLQADLLRLPFPPASFDQVFLCFVLEHLPRPERALRMLLRVLRPGGAITAIEGDHGSTFFHPQGPTALRAIQCLIDLQAQGGGDALIGRRLYPLFTHAGLEGVTVSPRFVYADASRPDWVEGFTRRTYIAMVQGVREAAIRAGLMSAAEWARGLRELRRAARPDGVFCYTFFKARGLKPR